ncbi:hypothetical protein B0H16DRAFT_1453892 [Mycena metata]|uniref:Uncharacterized protein n=1 Tax=Mycena metata TaxID=1033252 RepID=A0AAD7JKQ0_9AGAR|nr:hypothetical protein B0H16DRAFT_1453892 [Mycena metata]
MYHSGVQLSGSHSPISGLLITAFSLLSFILSSISSLDKDQLSAGSTPSRVSGDITPTPTIAFQDKPGFFFAGLFIVASLVIGSVAGTWLRSPAVHRQGRLNREPSPTPPPNGENLENGIEDDGAARDGGGGDDDPQEDSGVNDQNGVADGVGATAAAPAPEDPPPPPGGIEEDDEDNNQLNIGDDAVFWFLLFLLANALLSLSKHVRGNGSRAESVELWNLPTAEGSATIPGLLRQHPRLEPLNTQQINVARGLDPEVPTLVQQVADKTSFSSAATTLSKAHRFVVWRRAYLLFVGLPGLGFLLAVLRLLLPLSANRDVARIDLAPPPAVAECEEDPGAEADLPELPVSPTTPRQYRVPPVPHPSPASPPRQRPLAPLPFRDAATQEACNTILDFVRIRTAERIAREEDGGEDGVEERKQRVCVVQRRIWQLLYELRRGDADGDEEAAVLDDEELAA